MGQKGFAMRKPFGFDEELAEGGMRAISPVRRKSKLQVSGQLKPARFA